jgi:hypothetical protein
MAKMADDIRLGIIPYFPAKECGVIVRRLKAYDSLIGCVHVFYGRNPGALVVHSKNVKMCVQCPSLTKKKSEYIYAYS